MAPRIALLQQRGVDGGGVAIQLHADAQAVFEDGGDARALLGQLAFLLHQGRQGDGVVHAGGGVQAAPGFAELAGHHAAEPLGRGVAAEPVGVGEEVAFERGRLGIEIADQRGIARRLQKFGRRENAQLLGRGGDVEHVPAFGHHQLVVEDVAARDAAEHFDGAGGAVEAVFAGLQDALAAGEAGQQKIPAAAHHAGLRQQRRPCRRWTCRAEFDEGLALETLIRPCDAVDGKAAGGESREEHEAEGAQRASYANPDSSAAGSRRRAGPPRRRAFRC